MEIKYQTHWTNLIPLHWSEVITELNFAGKHNQLWCARSGYNYRDILWEDYEERNS